MNKKSDIEKKIEISFCIPTYNRSEIVFQCVQRLLLNYNFHFEILVSDNASTDDTLHLLSQINDERLRIISLPSNTGTFNLLHVARLARGEIITWLSDEDDIVMANLKNILDKFKNDHTLSIVQASTIFGISESQIIQKNRRFLNRGQALEKILNFSGCGGMFLRNTDFKKSEFLPKIDERNCVNNWNYYPVAFISALSLNGTFETTSQILCTQVRFGRTTLDWNSSMAESSRMVKRDPHFFPTSVTNRSICVLRVIRENSKIHQIQKFYLTSKVIIRLNLQLFRNRRKSFVDLIEQHYGEKVANQFISSSKRGSIQNIKQHIIASGVLLFNNIGSKFELQRFI